MRHIHIAILSPRFVPPCIAYLLCRCLSVILLLLIKRSNTICALALRISWWWPAYALRHAKSARLDIYPHAISTPPLPTGMAMNTSGPRNLMALLFIRHFISLQRFLALCYHLSARWLLRHDASPAWILRLHPDLYAAEWRNIASFCQLRLEATSVSISAFTDIAHSRSRHLRLLSRRHWRPARDDIYAWLLKIAPAIIMRANTQTSIAHE